MSTTSELVRRKSAKLLEKAKEVFGEDLVTEAYLCSYDLTQYGGEEDFMENYKCSIDALARVESDFNFETRETIDVDGETILIKFINGRTILFQTSEWGVIQLSTDDGLFRTIE